jgi:hypothetical protein
VAEFFWEDVVLVKKLITMKMDGVEEEDMEKEYFRRRFMLGRQSQTNGFDRLEVTDSRADMLWKLFDMNATPQGTDICFTPPARPSLLCVKVIFSTHVIIK